MRSLFEQFQQIQSSDNYLDNLDISFAELTGSQYSSNESMVVVSGSDTITGMSPVFDTDVDNYIVVPSGAATGIYQIVYRIDSSSVIVVPTPSGSDASATGDRYYYQNLEDDLNYIRTMLVQVTGQSNWYDTPSIDLLSLNTNFNVHSHDVFKYMSDGSSQATASGLEDTLTFTGAGSVSVLIDATSQTVTVSGMEQREETTVDMNYVSAQVWQSTATDFTAVPTALEIYHNGVKQKAGDDDYYIPTIVSGMLNIALNSGYNTYATDWVSASYTTGTTIPMYGIEVWQLKTADYLMSVSDEIMIDTTISGNTLTAPGSPSFNDYIKVTDAGGNCGVTSATLNMNGEKIMGMSENMVLDTNGLSFKLVYYNTARGWVFA